ncbi:MAG: phosphatase PAP2 family protein [Gammaproteobacteria bacterium]|uniref:phosphatase PAP2 family protein n=1 Tax=unclassified Limnobacter TaxID=2630203 RepID=UPI001226459B|nr:MULTISPECIES: phosphatase PAP2 family protein [unclassified Limnobacter]MBU0783746.1 phosphatase PAP2 family protein [Gammaproteobacteria bacterium]MBU0847780.1 phosphatase PAP2 family protein [Gammaproteobacteria bacterium]MBU1268761.1 phosphatase PAP2 family protein [Gammaproteobacteria bacterium]MBU1778791.1 phosphatase PAP2 family protein [Gammaproteobacteria bacterium]MBU2086287.1 phosphatase PAP2 family protein [Gammaproteobacteria bacterium]
MFSENSRPMHHWAAWTLLGVFIVFLNRYTGWDQAISNVFFDPQAASFPLKQNQWLSLLLHDGLRWLAAGIWLVFVLLLCLKSVRQVYWKEILFILLVSLLAALVVSVLKALSSHSCPWDLNLYGGAADYFRLFQNTHAVANPGPGKCFPSGHASTAFMWIVLLYSPMPWLKRHQTTVAIVVLFMGGLASGVQIAKGAHFTSHVLATAWLCWGVSLLAVDVRNTLSRHRCAARTRHFPPRKST